MKCLVMISAALALGIAAACGSTDAGGADSGTDALSCEHGTYSECVCPDGTMGTQLCAHDTSGFEMCMCGGADDDPTGVVSGSAEGGSSTSEGGVDPSTDGGTTVADATTSDATGSVDTGTGTTASVGEAPMAMINHPGVEDRQAGVAIPFVGVANDAEDGALAGPAMQWTDDLEGGVIGQGESFDAVLNVLGDHTVTLTATDSDGNVGEASLTFTIVQ